MRLLPAREIETLSRRPRRVPMAAHGGTVSRVRERQGRASWFCLGLTHSLFVPVPDPLRHALLAHCRARTAEASL